MNGKRLSDTNLYEYLKNEYNIEERYNAIIIDNVTPILQADYGEANDCALSSITALVNYLSSNKYTIDNIYNKTASIGKKYLYTPKHGTFTIFIKYILNKVLKFFNLKRSFKFRILKNILFNFSTIEKRINSNNPIILNIAKDGRNYYKNHSVLVIGYIDCNKVKILAIYDNWHKTISYIDYNKLSLFSSICY